MSASAGAGTGAEPVTDEGIVFMRACERDLPAVISLYAQVVKAMKRSSLSQWDSLYPNEDVIREDIWRQQLYLGYFEEKLVCAYVLNQQADDAFRKGFWTPNRKPYYVIHRLCVAPAFQGLGMGRRMMRHVEKQARALGAGSLRLDAYVFNSRAMKLCQNLGYRKVGLAEFRKGDFYLLEKRL